MPTQNRPSAPMRQPDYSMKSQNPMQLMQPHQTKNQNQTQNHNIGKKPAPILSAP